MRPYAYVSARVFLCVLVFAYLCLERARIDILLGQNAFLVLR